MNLENIGKDCPCYEVDCSDIMFDIGEFCGLPPNNGRLTIQVNGSTVGDFSANQQEDETINITTPTSQDIADAVAGEALLRQQADNTLQANIDAIASKSDVVDVVGTYAELQAYDTSKLDDNDVVKVLDDSAHNDSMTYYRWNKTTQTWSYIGQESPYYSKSQTDTLLAQKQDNLTAGAGITLNGSTISADTTVLAEKSELDNYAEKSNTYTKSEVDTLVEPKLSVDVVDSLPAVGEENKLYLTPKAHTTQTANDNPITATVTDDAGQIEDFQLDGDTFQQTYSGSNLLNAVPATSGYLNGLSATIENDGSIHLTGVSTANYSNFLAAQVKTLAAGNYVLSVDKNLPFNINLRVVYSDSTSESFYRESELDLPISFAKQVTSFYVYAGRTISGTTYNETFKLWLSSGSTATSFEPYVGGIASPNPDYPQPIQTVTGEQTVEIVGKNLLDIQDNLRASDSGLNFSFSNNELTVSGTPTRGWANVTRDISVSLPAGQYTFSVSKKLTHRVYLHIVYTDDTSSDLFLINAGETSKTVTLAKDVSAIRLDFSMMATGVTLDESFSLQLEKGSSATTYAPYSKTDYHISLGSIELCKLGTYQDYIYKDGDTWKVHKATATYTFDDKLLSWQRNTQISGGYVMSYNVNNPLYGVLAIGTPSYSSKCTHFTIRNDSTTWAGVGKAGFNAFGAFWCMTNIADTNDFLDWLGEDSPELFYPLATPTDTEITDTTLISQLNAIASASLENGSNTITNTATGSNLAGDMEVDYFGYDPTNRYDKWLWLNINNAYEKLGS